MRIVLPAAALLASFVAVVASADPAPSRPAQDALAGDPPARVRVTDPDVIAKAVRETLAEAPAVPTDGNGRALRADGSYEKFGRGFDEARRPSCLHPDAMKFQPPHLGPIPLGGILALPFWAAAAVRGKCN